MAEPETPPPSDPLSPGLGRIPGFGHPLGLDRTPSSGWAVGFSRPQLGQNLNQPSSEPTTFERPAPSNPHVLIFTCQQTKLASLSPFRRKDGCDRYGKVSRCDRLRDGSLEVEFVSSAEAEKALRAKTFSYTERCRGVKREVTLPGTVTPHRTKNFRQGVISCYELRDTSDEEIADGLSSSGVTYARRITTRRGGVTVPTDNVVLTFDANELPPAVAVVTYVPNPMRCFRCQRFGHTKTHCKNRPICAKCASTEHQESDCIASTPRCSNCVQAKRPHVNHASYDRSCPSYTKEKEIVSIKATRKILFREASEIYDQSHPAMSYAHTVRTPVTARTTLEEMSATQLLRLLKSFGLSVVTSGATLTSVEPKVSTSLVVPPSAAAGLPSPSPPSTSGGGEIAATAAASSDGDGVGWTEVQRRRKARGTRPKPPPQPAPTPSTLAPSGPAGSAVMDC